MPTAAEKDITGLQNLVSDIYRQNWPSSRADNKRYDLFSHSTSIQNTSGNEKRISGPEKINRPFSASLISSRRTNGRRLMSARPSSREKLDDAKSLNTATFHRTKSTACRRVPEYDYRKVISDSAAARNKALAAEYLAMLSGRNYLKRHYREQYWTNDAVSRIRPHTVASGQRRYTTLYPDLGSVIGGRMPRVAGSAVKSTPSRPESHWRVPSNTPKDGMITPNHNQLKKRASSSDENKVMVSELGLTFQAKKSWSNIPSGKCYRVLSQENDTLASLCLEGKSAHSRTGSSRNSSVSSTLSISTLEGRYALSSAGESSPSGSSEAMSGSRAGSGDEEDALESVPFSPSNDISVSKNDQLCESIEAPSEVYEVSDLTVDDEAAFIDHSNQDDGFDIVMEDDVIGDADCADFETDTIENGVGRISFSDFEESDISENEADDYEEEAVDEMEANRRLKQVSAVFDSTKDAEYPTLSDCVATIEVNQANDESADEFYISEDENDESENLTDEMSMYPEFLPRPYRNCDLKSLANLPPGMDWRALFHDRAKTRFSNSKCDKKHDDLEKLRVQRRAKERAVAKCKSIEDIVDRLVVLERLQSISEQYEKDRRKHYQHRAKARQTAKIVSAQQSSSVASTSNAAATPKENESRAQSARVLRRRPSNISSTSPTISKQRRSPSAMDSTRDISINLSSPDLDLVRLSCTKNHLQYIRRNSASPRKKQRQGLFLPRHYEYSWSERAPPSKRPSVNSLFFSKPRNCQYCRDNERKASHLHTVQILSRPKSSYAHSMSEKHRMQNRSNLSVTAISNAPEKNQKASEVTSGTGRSTIESISSSGFNSNRGIIAFGRADSSIGSTKGKIIAAKAALSTVARDYARASSRSGRKSRRASASMYRGSRSVGNSSVGTLKMRKNANVLKPKIIECSNLGLR